MDFSDALRAMKQGAHVRRHGWGGFLAVFMPADGDGFMFNRPFLYASCVGGEVVPALINDLDMMAEDWEIVPA